MGGVSGSDGTSLAAACAVQRAERNRCVRRDLALDLPPCLALPDGEERPYGSANRLRIRDYDQVRYFFQFFFIFYFLIELFIIFDIFRYISYSIKLITF